MDDPLLVRGVHDLAELVEQRHESLEPQRALLLDQLVERRAADQLHRRPQRPVVLRAERVDVRGIGMVELRGEARLAEEPCDVLRRADRGADLDHGLAPEQRLFGPVHHTEPTGPDLLAHDEVAERAADQRCVRSHRGATLSHAPMQADVGAPTA